MRQFRRRLSIMAGLFIALLVGAAYLPPGPGRDAMMAVLSAIIGAVAGTDLALTVTEQLPTAPGARSKNESVASQADKSDLIDEAQLEEARRIREEFEAERSKNRLVWLARFGVGLLFLSIVLLVVYMAFSVYAPDELGELTSTLIGTFVGALLAAATGVGLFYFQGKKNEEERVEYLQQALIAELQATVDRLKTTSAVRVSDPTGSGGPDIVVVLAHLEPTACEENIRSALFGHKNTVNLTRLARLMREYTKAADILSSLLWRPQMDPASPIRIYQQAANVKGLQQFVLLYCETVLKGFEHLGIEVPPEDKFYSDPTREAPPGFVRFDE